MRREERLRGMWLLTLGLGILGTILGLLLMLPLLLHKDPTGTWLILCGAGSWLSGLLSALWLGPNGARFLTGPTSSSQDASPSLPVMRHGDFFYLEVPNPYGARPSDPTKLPD